MGGEFGNPPVLKTGTLVARQFKSGSSRWIMRSKQPNEIPGGKFGGVL